MNGDEIVTMQGDRRYRICGLAKNWLRSSEGQRAVSRSDVFHVDTLDLQVDRQRAAFLKRAAEELRVNEETLRKDLGRVFLALERLQAEAIRKALDPVKPAVEMNDEERADALGLLRDPRLLDRISRRLCAMRPGMRMSIGYLAAVSRHLDSAAGCVVAVVVGGRWAATLRPS